MAEAVEEQWCGEAVGVAEAVEEQWVWQRQGKRGGCGVVVSVAQTPVENLALAVGP